MEAEEEDAPDAEVTFALIAKRCLPADFLESADAQQEGLLHNRRLIGHTTKVNHNTVVYQYRSCHTTPLYCTPGHRTKVNHNTVVYRYGSCHTTPSYCTISALLVCTFSYTVSTNHKSRVRSRTARWRTRRRSSRTCTSTALASRLSARQGTTATGSCDWSTPYNRMCIVRWYTTNLTGTGALY